MSDCTYVRVKLMWVGHEDADLYTRDEWIDECASYLHLRHIDAAERWDNEEKEYWKEVKDAV